MEGQRRLNRRVQCGKVCVAFSASDHCNLTYTGLIAYYNAGSAMVILVLVGASVGAFFWIRKRRQHGTGGVQLPFTSSSMVDQRGEEEIPLTENGEYGSRPPSRKGKERAMHEEEERIFDVGDSDESDTDEEARRRS